MVPHITDQESLEFLSPTAEDLGMEDVHSPLFDWLLVASTEPGDTPNTSFIRMVSTGTTPQGMLNVQVERNEDVLFHQLPALRPNQTSPILLSWESCKPPANNGTPSQQMSRTVSLREGANSQESGREIARSLQSHPEAVPCHQPRPTPNFWHRSRLEEGTLNDLASRASNCSGAGILRASGSTFSSCGLPI